MLLPMIFTMVNIFIRRPLIFINGLVCQNLHVELLWLICLAGHKVVGLLLCTYINSYAAARLVSLARKEPPQPSFEWYSPWPRSSSRC